MDTEHDKGHGGNAVGHVSPCGTQTVTGLEELATIECCDVKLMGKPLTGTEKGMGAGTTEQESNPCCTTASSIFLNETMFAYIKKILINILPVQWN